MLQRIRVESCCLYERKIFMQEDEKLKVFEYAFDYHWGALWRGLSLLFVAASKTGMKIIVKGIRCFRCVKQKSVLCEILFQCWQEPVLMEKM